MHHIDVIRIPCRSPGDTTGFAARIDSGRVAAADIFAVMGKTEGNGCVTDYTGGAEHQGPAGGGPVAVIACA